MNEDMLWFARLYNSLELSSLEEANGKKGVDAYDVTKSLW